MAHSRSFLADQKARNAIVGAENLLAQNSPCIVLDVLYCFKQYRLCEENVIPQTHAALIALYCCVTMHFVTLHCTRGIVLHRVV